MSQYIALRLRRASLWTKVIVLGLVGALPALLPVATAGAAPAITNRSLVSTSAQPSIATKLTWTFNTPTNVANANKIEIEFCDQPLAACTVTHTPTLAGSPTATLGGPWTSTGVSATTVSAGRSGGTNNQINITKTTADDATNKTGLTISLGASDVTNFGTPNMSYYTRLRIYSDAGSPPTTLVYEGAFAQSTSQTLTVNARVQENLAFCVGNTTVNDTTTSPGADCSAITGSAVDIGNIESGNTNVSPVDPVNGGDNTNGIAMIRTNAVNGASIAYHSLGDTGSGALKVPGATCVASPISTATTDQCFNTATGQVALTAGTEKFGMTIAGVNCVSTSAYTCSFAGNNYNLRRDTAYDGNASNTTYVADTNLVPGTTSAGYAWDADPANTVTIASSTAAPSGIKVIDDEALILKFAATSGITTPTGSYTVQADFIATTTF